MKFVRKTVSKADLVKHVQKELNCSRRTSLRVVNEVLKFIARNLESGCRVQFSPFGTFEVRHRAGHRGKNPKTGETFLVKAKRIVVFKPGKTLKNLRPE